MIRIANIIEDGRIAGPQLRMLAVARELKTSEIETVIIHPCHQSEQFAARLDQAGIAHVAMSLRRLSKGFRPVLAYLLHFPGEIIRLMLFFRRGNFDFVHCSGGFWQIKGLIAAKLAGRRAIWHLNDTILPVRLRPLFLFAVRHFADRLIFAGQRVRAHYLAGARPGVPAIEIQAPVNCAAFDPAIVAADARLDHFAGVKVITVSNLNPLKGLEYFTEMAALLACHPATPSFHIVGPVFTSQNRYVERVRNIIARHGLTNVHFHGPTDNVAAILKAADIYVCSSIAEASPTSVWEAMAMSKAIVSTDVGDVGRFAAEQACLAVPIRDPEALAAAVRRFLDDPELRAMFGAAARAAALRRLDLAVCVSGHHHVYTATRETLFREDLVSPAGIEPATL